MEIDIFRAENCTRSADIKFMLSSEIYDELDRISSSAILKQLNHRPPQIVVVGNETHGKRTLLERIIGLPIFPKDNDICRCPIRVHLRRVVGEPEISKISIVDIVTTALNPSHLTAEQRIPRPDTIIVALENMREVIRTKMNEIVAEQPNKIIIDDKEIVVEIRLPYCMNLDILDLPGLVTTNPTYEVKEEQDLSAATMNLATRIIENEKEFSFFLLVNDINVPPNQSKGCELIEKCQLKDKTVGILTQLDMLESDGDDEVAELQSTLNCEIPSSFPLKHGWLATSSMVPKAKSSDVNGNLLSEEVRKLQLMNDCETKYLVERFSPLSSSSTMVGIHSVRQKLQCVYEQFIKKEWIGVIKSHLLEQFKQYRLSNEQLGIPVARNEVYAELLTFLNQKLQKENSPWVDYRTPLPNRSAFGENYIEPIKTVQTIEMVTTADSLLNIVRTQVTRLSGSHWISPSLDEELNKLIDSYTSFVEKAFHCAQTFSTLKHVSHSQMDNLINSVPRLIVRDANVICINQAAQVIVEKIEQLNNHLQSIVILLLGSINEETVWNDLGTDTVKFNVNRFVRLWECLKPIILKRFTDCKDEFSEWFDKEWVEKYITPAKNIDANISFESPVLIMKYPIKSSLNAISFALKWNDQSLILRYPYLLVIKWCELVKKTKASLCESILSPDIYQDYLLETESCESQRLQILMNMKECIQEYEALEALETKLNSII